MAEAGRSFCLSCLTLTFCPFRLSSVFKLCPKTQQWFKGYMIHHYENAINSLQEITCLSLSRSLFSFFISNDKNCPHFSTFSMFSPLALHIWLSVSWTAATHNASGSTPHGTEILAKYFPPSYRQSTPVRLLLTCFCWASWKYIQPVLFLLACSSYHRSEPKLLCFPVL